MLKVHEMIEKEKPEFVQDIKAHALRVGLDKIDFDDVYTLKKLGAKTLRLVVIPMRTPLSEMEKCA